ncbi:hypothetical protein [Streptomyces roseolus]|uniref:hypothetical protein n=1 Tax=Streptomyces roseolus TaxID=67358 RepID=UPI0019C3BC5E|nr:hypothetical protein [Streptomyces roseolus]GGR63255.1 hypothetical protein GCM10010282_65390 [Streptomyces roseolus]
MGGAPQAADPRRQKAFLEAAKLIALRVLRFRAGTDAENRLRADVVTTALEGGAGAVAHSADWASRWLGTLPAPGNVPCKWRRTLFSAPATGLVMSWIGSAVEEPAALPCSRANADRALRVGCTATDDTIIVDMEIAKAADVVPGS